jgi:hypothetical protein
MGVILGNFVIFMTSFENACNFIYMSFGSKTQDGGSVRQYGPWE